MGDMPVLIMGMTIPIVILIWRVRLLEVAVEKLQKSRRRDSELRE